jgi:hypothetical protein
MWKIEKNQEDAKSFRLKKCNTSQVCCKCNTIFGKMEL